MPSEKQTTCTSSTSTGYTEESSDTISSDDIIIPQPIDIILGRGKGNTKNPGNIIFQGTKNDLIARIPQHCPIHIRFACVIHAYR